MVEKLHSYYILSSILILVTVSSCGNSNIENTSNEKLNEEQILKIDASWFDPKPIYKNFDIDYIKLETKEASLIGSIDDIKFDENYFFVLDKKVAKGVFIFTNSGEFIAKIGISGNGPKELSSINDFTIDTSRKKIYISDLRLRKLLVYDYRGAFIEEFRNNTWFYRFEHLADGKDFLYYLSHYGRDENNFGSDKIEPLVILGNENGDLEKVLIEIPVRNNLTTIVENFHLVNNKNLYLSKVLDPSIYKVESASKDITKLYEIDFEQYNLPDNYLSIATNNYRIYARDELISQLKSFVLNREYLIINYENPVALEGTKVIISCLINRKNNQTMHYYLPTNLADARGKMVPTLRWSHQNNFLGYFDAADIISANSQSKNSIFNNYKHLKNISEYDNPIIVKARVKE